MGGHSSPSLRCYSRKMKSGASTKNASLPRKTPVVIAAEKKDAERSLCSLTGLKPSHYTGTR